VSNDVVSLRLVLLDRVRFVSGAPCRQAHSGDWRSMDSRYDLFVGSARALVLVLICALRSDASDRVRSILFSVAASCLCQYVRPHAPFGHWCM
jgi:hypothetical protein